MIKLIDIYITPIATSILYQLLEERDNTINISHKQLPTYPDHVAYIESRPYLACYLLEFNNQILGSCYLTHQYEIGIFIFRKFWSQHFGTEAVQALMTLHGSLPYRANINPQNTRSIRLFEALGFNLTQLGYSK